MSASLSLSRSGVIVPLHEWKQPDVFCPSPHVSHDKIAEKRELCIPIFYSSQCHCSELLCFCHMGKSTSSLWMCAEIPSGHYVMKLKWCVVSAA